MRAWVSSPQLIELIKYSWAKLANPMRSVPQRQLRDFLSHYSGFQSPRPLVDPLLISGQMTTVFNLDRDRVIQISVTKSLTTVYLCSDTSNHLYPASLSSNEREKNPMPDKLNVSCESFSRSPLRLAVEGGGGGMLTPTDKCARALCRENQSDLVCQWQDQ